MLDAECGMWNVGYEMLDVGFGMGHAARECSPTDHTRHRCRAGCFYQKTRDSAKPHRPTEGNCTDAHGWVFSRIVYSCSAAYCLGFDAPPAQRIDTDFLQAESTMK